MIVSNENHVNKLNILTGQNNTTAKEILKEADVKTLLSKNKDINLSTVLKSLFKSVGKNNQSNQTILNLLKRTNISKDMGSFTSNSQQLLKSLPNNENTKSLKTFLQNFLVNINNSKSTNIKDQFSKSGIFLESKIAKEATTDTVVKSNSPILNDMKTLLLKTKAQLTNLQGNQNTQITKESINTNETLKLVDKILNQLSKNENILPNDLKAVLSKIKNDIQQNQTTQINKPETLNQLDKLISKLPTTTSVQENQTNKAMQNEIKTTLTKVQTLLQNQIQQAQTNSIPKEIINKTNENLKQIDKVLSKFNKSEVVTNNQIKDVLSNAKTQIENLTQNISKALNQNSQVKSSTSQLFALKAQLQNNTNDTLNPKEVIKQIDKILTQLSNLETKQPSQSLLNTHITKNHSPIFHDIKTLLTKVQTQLQTQLQNQFQNQNVDEIKSQIQNMKDNDPTDSIKNIDKLLNQIDYHQLYSLANSSNNVYVPFLWDLLEDGSIDIKKSAEDKFYCIIDLSLKDLGNVDIHLNMFNKENLDISIYVEKDETKQLIRQKISSLKQAFFNSDIKTEAINIYSKKLESKNSEKEFYNQDDNFNFGLDIKV